MHKGWAALAAVAMFAAQPAQADDVADFYRGKRVNMIVSYGPGGGYDVYGRVLSRHFEPAYPRQSQYRGAEHAGRGKPARRQLHLQRRAARMAPPSARSRATWR